MVAIFLIGIITAMGLPRFLRSRRSPAEEFIGRLTTLIGEGVATAQQTGTVQHSFLTLMLRQLNHSLQQAYQSRLASILR